MKNTLMATTMLVGGLVSSSAVIAQEQVLTVGAYGGSTETLMKESIIPQFEATHDVRIEYVAGNSTENLARLQAQSGNQELDVVLLDDGPMYQAMQLGFCGEITNVPNIEKSHKLARLGENLLGLGIVGTVMGYNTKVFKENGWAAPASWGDLANPDYAGRIALSAISGTYGLHTLVMLARINGGGESDIDPGFKFMQEKVAPNVLTFESNAGPLSELLQNEEVALTVWGTHRIADVQKTGVPLEVVFPEEGAVALMITGCPIAGSEQFDLAQEFLNYLLDTEVQTQLAETQGWGPVNQEVVLSDELAARVPYGPEEIAKLLTVDWDTINRQRQEWTQRWVREIER
jgi:putative spermidine/putrescine transport system substrate-binding protein